MSCRRAFDVDLAAFVHDARGPMWADFREHYLLCRDCSLEVRTWTELEIILRGGTPPATTHPAPEDLLAWAGESAPLDPDYGRIVDYHLAGCLACADEIATLRAFDFAGLEADRATAVTGADPVGATNGQPVIAAESIAASPPASPDVAVEDVDPLVSGPMDVPPDAERERGGPEPATAGAPSAVALELDGAASLADDALDPATVPGDATAAVVDELDPLARPRRGVRVLLHPALGVALVLGFVLAALWLGLLPRPPLGRLAGAAAEQARVAVRTVLERGAAPGSGAEAAPAARAEAAGADSETTVPPLEEGFAGEPEAAVPAPGGSLPDAGEPATGATVSEDLWALARLDEAGPLEIVADQLDAGLELEVPVPLTVRAGAVLQVDIRADAARQIVERLPFPGVREVAVRVPAAWLVPGAYEITLGVVRAGPAPVRVARYALVVY